MDLCVTSHQFYSGGGWYQLSHTYSSSLFVLFFSVVNCWRLYLSLLFFPVSLPPYPHIPVPLSSISFHHSLFLFLSLIYSPSHHPLTHSQLEQEVDALNRKLKLLEADLDTAEDKAADSGDRCKDLEDKNEELERENKQLQHRIQRLEGEIVLACVCVCVCDSLSVKFSVKYSDSL